MTLQLPAKFDPKGTSPMTRAQGALPARGSRRGHFLSKLSSLIVNPVSRSEYVEFTPDGGFDAIIVLTVIPAPLSEHSPIAIVSDLEFKESYGCMVPYSAPPGESENHLYGI